MGVLSTGIGVISGVFGAIGGFLSLVVDIMGRFGVLLFIGGFFGLLLTFLWFLFRYIDKKRLALPTIFFVLFFVVFLSGNILMIVQDARAKEAASAQTEASAPAPASDGETVVL